MKNINHNKYVKKVQLILIYIYAFLALNATITGYAPDEATNFFAECFPILEPLTTIQVKTFQHSERSFFTYLLLIDFITKPVNPLHLSRIVKFNLVLIFIFEMFLIFSVYVWDLLSLKDMDLLFEYSEFDLTEPFYFFDNLFYSGLWMFYVFLYIYCFIYAMRKKRPKFPGFAQKIVGSVIFLFARQDRLEQIVCRERDESKMLK